MSKKQIKEFLSYLSLSENKSVNTLSSYKRDLNFYEIYQKKYSHKLFQEYLSEKGLSARSQARVISAVRSYFRFLEGKGCKTDFRDHPPSFKIHLPHFVTYEEFKKILKASEVPRKSHYTYRNRLVLYLFFSLACRVSELVSIDISDYIDSDESIIITGKGNKQRILPVTEPLLSHLRHYILKVREIFAPKTQALILNNRGKRPSRVDIWRWIRSFCQKAGIQKSPHQFRHGCATELLDHGADLRSIQKLLGHSSIETTKIYTHVTKNKMKKEVKNHHPLSKSKS